MAGAAGAALRRRRQWGFLALGPEEPIPAEVTAGGFNLGHALLGTSRYEVVQFAFEFYGFETYHVLVNPSNPLVQTVLTSMVESDKYLLTVRGDNRIPSFTRNSLAMRCSPHAGFSFAIRRIRA